jgi:hypothetical protein
MVVAQAFLASFFRTTNRTGQGKKLSTAPIRCDWCGPHSDVDKDGVVCPLCARRSPLRSADIEAVIEA